MIDRRVILYDRVGVNLSPDAAAAADALANPTLGGLQALPSLFNETTWDRQRNNALVVLLASAIRSADVVVPIQANYNASGVMLFILVTANPAGGETLAVSIHGDDLAGNTTAYLATQALPAANVMYTLTLAPGATDAAVAPNYKLSGRLPRRWHVYIHPSVAGVGHEWTYGIQASYLH